MRPKLEIYCSSFLHIGTTTPLCVTHSTVIHPVRGIAAHPHIFKIMQYIELKVLLTRIPFS